MKAQEDLPDLCASNLVTFKIGMGLGVATAVSSTEQDWGRGFIPVSDALDRQ